MRGHSRRGFPRCIDVGLCRTCHASGRYADRGPFVRTAHLWRLVIDRRYQQRGLGRRALASVVGLVRSRGYTALQLAHVPTEYYRVLRNLRGV